jgi:hypothetical protein
MTIKQKAIGVVVTILAVILLGFWLYSDTQFGQRKLSHIKSSVVGLNRTINVYAYDGKLIKGWQTRSAIERPGDGTQSFFKENGKRVDTMGGIVIAEED